jgi:hypothetical protein
MSLKRPTRAILILLTCIVWVVAGIAGCGGGSHTSIPTIIKPNVVVLPSDGSIQIHNLTETSLTLAGTVPNLQVGTVLINPQGNKFFRVASSISNNGTNTTIQTTNATVEDVIQQANIRYTAPLNPQEGTFTPMLPGVGLPIYRSVGRDTNLLSITIPFNNVEIEAEQGIGQTSGTIAATLNGTVTISFAVDFALDATPLNGLELIRVAPKVTAQSNLRIVTHGLEFSQEYAHQTFHDIPIPETPLKFDLDVSLSASGGVEISNSAGIEFAVTTSQVAKAGFQWSRQDGIKPVADFSLDAHLDTPRLHKPESVAIGISFSEIGAFFKLYGLAGPELTLKAPNLKWSVERTLNPSGLRFKSGSEFVLGGSLKAELFKRTLVDVVFLDHSFLKQDYADIFYADNGIINIGIH